MEESQSSIKSVKFNDIAVSDHLWDVVYKEYGIALRDGLGRLAKSDDVMEIEMIVFLVCLEGSMKYVDSGKTYSITPGKVLIRLPGAVVSEFETSPDFKCKVLCLSPTVFANYVTETGFFEMILSVVENPVFEMGINSDSIMLLDAYSTILKIKSKHSGQNHIKKIIPNLVECLLYEILSNIPVDNTKQLRQTHGQKFALFNRFIDLVARDNGRLRSVKKYAEKLNVSPKYLTTVSKEQSGKSASDWVNDILKKEIEHLLQHSDLTAKEIADTLGFPDASLFAKYMRQHFKMTAMQLRVQLRSSFTEQ